MSADQLAPTSQQSVALVPCFSLGDKLLAPELKITSLPGGHKSISGSLNPQKTAALAGNDTLELFGTGPDALKLNLYDLVSGLGLKLDGPLRDILQSDLQNAQISYLSDDKVTYIEFTTEHYSAVYLSALNQTKTGQQTLCAVNCNTDLDIAKLIPLTDAQNMPECQLTAGLMYANVAMTKADVTRLRTLCQSFAKSGIKLLSADKIEPGIAVVANMAVGDKVIPLYLPLKGKTADKNDTLQTPTKTTQLQPASTSAPVGKSLGPVSIASFGLDYQDDDLILTVDAALNMASFQMEMMGMSLKLNFNALMRGELADGLGFDLDGLYMAMQSGGIGLSGGLLRSEIVENGVSRDEYVGQLALKTKTFSLTALGAYSRLSNGDHSLFAYLALNFPLGGIPPFFVEGLALGFGYNRGILVPPIDEVNRFPLVTALQGGQSIGNNLDKSAMATVKQQFQALSKYLPAISDQYLIAAGIKFSTFKMIDSIAVLMVEFGNRVSVHLVGTSDMRLPFRASNPVVCIEMAYRVSFMPDKGELQVDALLTDNSFVLSRDCKLTGGFAYYAWFDGPRSGDFVVSLGGYHPNFNKPSYYPSVPRLGFLWQVTDDLSFKGEMYAALTPVAIMAGAAVQAAYDSGPLSAWFKAGLNFIIYWQPFYYEADFMVSIGARVELDMGFLGSVSFSTELGAALQVWGPEFSGIAKVNWAIFEFTIRFGAGGKPRPAPIGWCDFEANYIPPKASDLAEINVVKGERSVVDDWHLVDPDEFELVIGSQIPLNRASVDGTPTKQQRFHLAPMGALAATDWTMTVTSIGVAGVTFVAQAIDKQYPKAVWGPLFTPDIGQEDTTMALLSGLKVVSMPGKPPGFTEAVDADEFKFTDVVENDPYWQWGTAMTRATNQDAAQNAQTITDTLQAPDVVELRDKIASFFDCQDPIDVSRMQHNLEPAFIGTPQTVAA